jgi:hypothetical protein
MNVRRRTVTLLCRMHVLVLNWLVVRIKIKMTVIIEPSFCSVSIHFKHIFYHESQVHQGHIMHLSGFFFRSFCPRRFWWWWDHGDHLFLFSLVLISDQIITRRMRPSGDGVDEDEELLKQCIEIPRIPTSLALSFQIFIPYCTLDRTHKWK